MTQGGMVTFRDDGVSKIVGIGNISKSSSIILENILLVDDLKANLINVSQLCDKYLDVTFKHGKWLIVNNNGELIFKATKDKNVY